MVDVAYAGAKGTHLPWYSLSTSALPDRFFNTASLAMLKSTSPNPFMGVLNPTSGLNSATTVTGKQLVSPNPQYNNGMGIASADFANSDYHSLQVKMQKRFTGGASISAGYTYAKLISATDTLTGWLESSSADNWGVIDPNHLELEKALSSNDVRSRLVVSYVYDIPVGRGKAILPDIPRVADEVIGGWGVEGITTFQTGFPIPMSGFSNLNGDYGFGQRPAIVAGCNRTQQKGGPIETRQFFNPSCYAQAPEFTFGMQRNDSQVRAPGIDNWDTSIFKNFPIDKDGKVNLVFRTEFFNVWNRTQFGVPNGNVTGAQAAEVSNQANLPRLIQFAMRIKF